MAQESTALCSKKKVLLGMSGGVDSSAAAALLLEQGYDVTGVTLFLRPEESPCDQAHGASADIQDAARVAEVLGIPHIMLDLRDTFKKHVIENFVSEYDKGRTPNPCVVCNIYIKFGAMLDYALEHGYDYIATGHYARITEEHLPDGSLYYQLRSVPSAKDQSYMLFGLSQKQLSHVLFPIADFTKEEIRAIAEKAGLPVAHKADSQEICFVPDTDYVGFLEKYTGKIDPPGDFVDMEGNILGGHKGITHYTIGQRKGLGIALGRPMYVTSIRPEKNQVVLGPEGSQYKDSLTAESINWITPLDLSSSEGITCTARIRYHASPAPCTLFPLENGMVRAEFEKPQRSVTPGQAVVFYREDTVLGGGIICREE